MIFTENYSKWFDLIEIDAWQKHTVELLVKIKFELIIETLVCTVYQMHKTEGNIN